MLGGGTKRSKRGAAQCGAAQETGVGGGGRSSAKRLQVSCNPFPGPLNVSEGPGQAIVL